MLDSPYPTEETCASATLQTAVSDRNNVATVTAVYETKSLESSDPVPVGGVLTVSCNSGFWLSHDRAKTSYTLTCRTGDEVIKLALLGAG